MQNLYTHHPLYLIELPINLANNIVKVIKQVEVLSLTIYMSYICKAYVNKATYYYIGQFILLPQYNILCKKYRVQILRTVHSSLNIKD